MYDGNVEEGRLFKAVNLCFTWPPNKRTIQTHEIGCTTHNVLVMIRGAPREWCFWCLNSKRLLSTSHPLCWVLLGDSDVDCDSSAQRWKWKRFPPGRLAGFLGDHLHTVKDMCVFKGCAYR